MELNLNTQCFDIFQIVETLKTYFVITDNPFQLKAVYEIDDYMNKK